MDESFKAAHRVWIVNHDHRIFAIQSVCTHLGCTPNWMDSEHKFKCPCHGSGYTIDGINFEGPAPFPMRRYEVTMADDGQIIVNQGQFVLRGRRASSRIRVGVYCGVRLL